MALAATMIASEVALPAPDRGSPSCFGGMRSALVRGGFSGPLICSRGDATFSLAGQTKGHKYSIYDYRYRFLPANGNVRHGGQRIIVFRGTAYAGQYMIATPPYTSMSVNGTRVVFQTAGAPRVQIDFSRGPPNEILVNGEVARFFR
ncbi:hypothetical protein FHR20_000365 [Sphingomonas leidyi]|uniref:Uncharacterized protein n=1 Tax=Sphingomonas leidyi TaxID=68569 RepID=A0A7X5ZU85_9SPHN|nr:hypothetical protein [Sphingomonas leidyi]